MTNEERTALREQYHFRCGYCGISETDAGSELTVDHFQPTSKGGTDTFENWVYCCFACNVAKADYWQPNSDQRVLHPLHDRLEEHIVEREDGTLLGLTETGRFHIERLRLNRHALVPHRLEKRRRERETRRHAEVTRRLAEIQDELSALRQRLQEQFPRG